MYCPDERDETQGHKGDSLKNTQRAGIEGFISVERFESVSQSGRFISVSTWEDLDAVKRWREHLEHAAAQNEAKDRGIFRNYRIRVAEVIRDYGP